MKKIITTLVLVSVSLSVLGNDTIVSDTTVVDTVTAAIPATTTASGEGFSWALIATLTLGIYELTCRLVPTVKNISVLSMAMKVISILVPNLKKGGGFHK